MRENAGSLSEDPGPSGTAGSARDPAEASTSAEVVRLRAENAELLADRARTLQYVRDKVNQLLGVMGTVPLRPEELDDRTLLDLDPIGIVANAFCQVLEHLHETNRELQVAHAELAAVYDSAGVGIVVLDAQQRIVSYNRQACGSVLGGDREAVGKLCYQAICGRDRPLEVCSFRRACELRQPTRRPDWVNRDRHYDVISAPILDTDGRIDRVVLVYLDLTERQASSRALAASEERYRDLFE
ncbi:MAG: PAS domain-containing protein, partial [Proteobacteria bacterium]|nr:PAS domain-containing protein [Pseudomonadota bacterium]